MLEYQTLLSKKIQTSQICLLLQLGLALQEFTVNPKIFGRILFLRLALKDKNSQVGHDLPISVKDIVISPFHEGFFHETSHMRSFAKIKASPKFLNL